MRIGCILLLYYAGLQRDIRFFAMDARSWTENVLFAGGFGRFCVVLRGGGWFVRKKIDIYNIHVTSELMLITIKNRKKYFGSFENGCIFASAFAEKRGLLKSPGSKRTLKRMRRQR